jgi:glutaredoxin 3
MSSLSGAQFVKSLISKHAVVVFSKTTCPFCVIAKDVLKSTGARFHVVELNQMHGDGNLPTGSDIQNACHQITGQRTVPNVFINGTSIGGGSETRALHEAGELVPLLKKAGALP